MQITMQYFACDLYFIYEISALLQALFYLSSSLF